MWDVFRQERIVDSDCLDVPVDVPAAFAPIQRIGGDVGWYFGDALWAARGWFDSLVGGDGLRRGRRHPVEIEVGDTIDFWRVEAYSVNEQLRLRAEMTLPGEAWLEFRVSSAGPGRTRIEQDSMFQPSGVAGRAYWYAVYPLHRILFSGMLKEIGRAAQSGVVR